MSTFFKAIDASSWYERIELLTLNADQFALAMLGHFAGHSTICFGASFAVRRQTLDDIGGLESLASYLVEDYEMGRRIAATGRKIALVDYVVDTRVDLDTPLSWWKKQIYWDQHTRAAIPALFAASLLVRIVPIGLVLGAVRGFDHLGLLVVAGAVCTRLVTTSAVLVVALHTPVAQLSSLWLLPIKDVLGLCWFGSAYLSRTAVWRGVRLALSRDGRVSQLHGEVQ